MGEYRLCCSNDVELHFNHYVSMEEAERKWNDRLGRLNWNNLFIMMFTEDYQAAEHFDSLSYDKKYVLSRLEAQYNRHFVYRLRIKKCRGFLFGK